MSLNDEQRRHNMRMISIYTSSIIGLILMYILGYCGSLMNAHDISAISALLTVLEQLSHFKVLYALNSSSLLGMLLGIVVGVFIFFCMENDSLLNYAYKDDETAGTGGFMSQKEMKEYAEKYIQPDPEPIASSVMDADLKVESSKYSQNIIMSNSFCRPNNSRDLIGNNNVLVVGGAGTGKSRFVIKPNMLQMNCSYVITDPSGEMITSLGTVLREHGYKIKIFNIADMTHSNCYNPIRYVRDEAGVNMVIDCLINNTTKGRSGGDNQFFVDAEKLLYSACIYYLIDYCHVDSRKNFSSIMNMINSSSVNEQNPNAKSPLDLLFDKLPTNSLAFKYYKAFKQAAGKTLKSIIISCVTRLQPFMTPQVVNLTKVDTLDLGKLGDEKTALFIITPQADRTYSFLASMLYSQLFETLYHKGEQQKANGASEQMHIPVRCLMDEFANIGEVPEFPSKLSTMRKYNISATIVLQDIAQIEAMYKDNWKTLVGNCSTIIFLGTQEPNTLKYFSDLLGKKTIKSKSRGVSKGGKGGSNKNFQNIGREVMTPDELGRMPADECIVYTQNMRPVRDKKYCYENHPYYPYTADANTTYVFKYVDMAVYNNTNMPQVDSIIQAQAEMNRYKLEEKLKKGFADEINKARVMNADIDINRWSLPEAEEDNFFQRCLQTSRLQAASFFSDPICVFRMYDVPTKHLRNLVVPTAQSLSKRPLIIFSNTIPKENHVLVGYGIDNDDHLLERKLKELQEEETQIQFIKDPEYDLFAVLIYEAGYEEYRKRLLNKHLNTNAPVRK